MITFENVTVTVEGRTILENITLRLTERRIAVIGANGSGKTTLMRLVNGLARPSQGRVTVDDIDAGKDPKAVRRLVGILFQDPDSQIVMPLVEEDLRFSLKPLKLGREAEEAAVTEILARYGLTHLREQPAHMLSGGEKQLLALANVLIRKPRHVLLDEPTTLLDLRNRRRIAEAVAALEESVICVTHDLDFIRDFERVLVLDGGRIAFDGPPETAIPHYEAMAA